MNKNMIRHLELWFISQVYKPIKDILMLFVMLFILINIYI